jgi:hypothetical protein
MASLDSSFVRYGWGVVSGDDEKPMLWVFEFEVVTNHTWSGLGKCQGRIRNIQAPSTSSQEHVIFSCLNVYSGGLLKLKMHQRLMMAPILHSFFQTSKPGYMKYMSTLEKLWK